MGIKIKQKGNFEKTTYFLKYIEKLNLEKILRHYGEIGVEELSKATPVDTGLTAASWYYVLEKTKDGYSLQWNNSNVVNYVNIAIIIDTGHATRGHTYVQGKNYIEPTLRDVIDKLEKDIWREVNK